MEILNKKEKNDNIKIGEESYVIKAKKKSTKNVDIFTPLITTENIILPFNAVGKNIQETILKILKRKFEGRCMKHGYVAINSIKIITISSGIIIKDQIKHCVSFQCHVCFPVENMVIDCTVKNITKAGIRAEISKYEKSPMVIFVARDHNYNNDDFNNVEEGGIIKVKIIGQRFELNDEYISVIAEMI